MDPSVVKRWFIAGAGLSLAVGALLMFGPLNRLAVGFLRPFLLADSEISTTGERFGTALLGDRVRAQEEIDALRNEIVALELKLAQAREAVAENRELRNALALGERPSWHMVAAPVIARDPMDWNRAFRIGRGRAHGIALGAVVLNGTAVIGRVMTLTETTAGVTTIADPRCRLSVRVAGVDGSGLMAGRSAVQWYNHPVCVVDFLPRDAEYKEGLDVTTSGLSENVPVGLVVGRLVPWHGTRVGNIVDSAYAQVRVNPSASFGDFRHVTVISPVVKEP